jgi:hypothetical protein
MKRSRLISLLILVALNAAYCISHFDSKVYAYATYGCKTNLSICANGAGVCDYETGSTGNIYCACYTDLGSYGTYGCQGADD